VSKSCDECKGSFARGCEAKRWSHWTCSSLGTILQPVRINSVLDVKCFCNNKKVVRAQSMVWHFVRHPVKPTRYTSFPNLVRHESLHVSGSLSAHNQEFIYSTLGIGVCHTGLKTAFEQDQDETPCRVCDSWWWAEELPETCRVSCRSKFGKLVHLVGFIIKKLTLIKICFIAPRGL